jgi:hypothetical protein
LGLSAQLLVGEGIMADRGRAGASWETRGRTAPRRKVEKRPDSDIAARVELRTMREIVLILVQAITNLLASVPKDSRNTKQVARIEATLAKLQGMLAERRKSWARETFKA